MNNNQRLREVAELYRFKGEVYNIDGPYHFKDSKYWIIQYVRKSRFRGIRGSTVIILSEDGSIVKDWTTYHIVSKAYLTPKISSKFIDMYSCLLYTSPSPRDLSTSRMPSSA